jgi:hypothetical protein
VTDQQERSGATDERGQSEVRQEQDEPADEQAEQGRSAMDPRVKASLLWGAIGVLSFLVLLQGYELATGFRYPLTVKVGVTLLVGVGATGLSYAAEPLLFE